VTWHTRSRRIVPAVAIAAGLLPAAHSQEPGPTASSASGHHARGVEFHNARRLDEASLEYARALSLDPPRAPTAAELTVISRFANFRPKTEWPRDVPAGQSRAPTPPTPVVEAASLDDFQLPPKTVFDRAMPRYPNVWFYVDASLADSQAAAMRLVADHVRAAMRVRESYGPFSNPEGADFEVTIEHLQPWEDAAQRALQHAHAFHMRYYHSALAAAKLDRVTLRTRAGSRDFYRVAASAHYEVGHSNPNHADVEICPFCGRTGEYASQPGNLVERVHDPLGLELLLNGTIRNAVVRYHHEDQREIGGIIGALGDRFAVQRQVFEAQSGDRNTLRIGVVVIGARR
jgi:hypothetical protein